MKSDSKKQKKSKTSKKKKTGANQLREFGSFIRVFVVFAFGRSFENCACVCASDGRVKGAAR